MSSPLSHCVRTMAAQFYKRGESNRKIKYEEYSRYRVKYESWNTMLTPLEEMLPADELAPFFISFYFTSRLLSLGDISVIGRASELKNIWNERVPKLRDEKKRVVCHVVESDTEWKIGVRSHVKWPPFASFQRMKSSWVICLMIFFPSLLRNLRKFHGDSKKCLHL